MGQVNQGFIPNPTGEVEFNAPDGVVKTHGQKPVESNLDTASWPMREGDTYDWETGSRKLRGKIKTGC